MNLEAMARTYAQEKGLLARRGSVPTTEETLPVVRAYHVGPPAQGKTIERARADLGVAAVPLKIRRDGKLIDADPKLELQAGDVVSLVASLRAHKQLREQAKSQLELQAVEDVLDADLLDYHIKAQEIVVINKHVLGRPLGDLDLPGNHGCFATGLNRSGIELPVTDEAILAKGDRVHVIGEESRLGELATLMGHIEEEIEETDLVTFSLGIALGSLIGLITVSIGGVAIGLGTAGGLLIVGIAFGYLGSVNPTFGRVPGAARYLLSELGLMLLMASIGLNAGGGIVEGFLSVGPLIILSALVIAILPLAIGFIVGRRVLKMNPALLLGSLTGAMTSTPALNVVTEAAKSSVPAIGYAGTYTFANVLLTFAGTIMIGL
jgi:putative transport protein